MAAGYHLPEVRAAFGTFTYAHTGLGSAFSRWLEEALTRSILATKRVKLFARHAAAAMDPAYREVYREHFQTGEADALLYGRFAAGEAGGGPALHLELASLSTGELLGAADLSLPASALPAGMELEPPGLARAEGQRANLTGVLGAPVGKLTVKAMTDRGEGGVYRSGEELQVHVFVNRDAWLKVYHVDVAGKTQLIFPNQFHSDNRVAGGGFVRIPEEHYPFQFLLGEPYGTEFIKVVASSRPFADSESAFTELAGPAREVVTRGLKVAAADPETAEALTAYTIVEK